MRLKNLLTAAFFTAALVSFSFVHAGFINLDIDLTNGIRHDSLSGLFRTFSPPPTSSTNSDTDTGPLISTDSIRIKNICFYQIGLKAKWRPCNWIARLEGSYGISEFGCYRDIVTSAATGIQTVYRAKVHKGRSGDYVGGVGYLFPISRFCSMGLVGGWSYHRQRVEGRSVTRNGDDDPTTKLQYSNRWQGPWIGFETALDICLFSFHGGYEYHWTDWNGTWRFASADISRRSFSEKYSPRADVFFCDGRWYFWPFWNVGMSFRTERWRTNRGINNPQPTTTIIVTPIDSQVIKTKHAKWCTYVVTVDLGLSF